MKKRTWKIVVAVCIAIAGLALLNAAGAQVRPHGPSQAPGPHRPARPAVPPGNWHGGGMGWWGWGLGFGLGWEASPFVFPYYYPYTGIYEPFDIEGTEEIGRAHV